MRFQAKKRAINATAMNSGRYGSSRVRFPIHAPLKPSVMSTSGPRQHVEARTAARPPSASTPDFDFSDVMHFLFFLSINRVISVLRYGVKHEEEIDNWKIGRGSRGYH